MHLDGRHILQIKGHDGIAMLLHILPSGHSGTHVPSQVGAPHHGHLHATEPRDDL